MGYTSVRGGRQAIEYAEWLAMRAVRDPRVPLPVDTIGRKLSLAVDQVMGEGGLYDARLGALALKQAEGDLIEAGFLIRAYRSTLPHLGYSLSVSGDRMRVVRRISAAFRDIPGGQLLGRTRDYTQRLLDHSLGDDASDDEDLPSVSTVDEPAAPSLPLVVEALRDEGLLERRPSAPPEGEPADITRDPPRFPAPRSARLQMLARGETGTMLGMAYACLRGFGPHPTIGELRSGDLPVLIAHPFTGRTARVGWVEATEAHNLYGGRASKATPGPDFSLSYGIAAGRNERKAISMGILDESLRNGATDSPLADQEFVLQHIDSVAAMGFVEHLKLPHYVTFQASVQRSDRLADLIRASEATA